MAILLIYLRSVICSTHGKSKLPIPELAMDMLCMEQQNLLSSPGRKRGKQIILIGFDCNSEHQNDTNNSIQSHWYVSIYMVLLNHCVLCAYMLQKLVRGVQGLTQRVLFCLVWSQILASSMVLNSFWKHTCLAVFF